MDQLPQECWGIPPQWAVIGISPYGKAFNTASNAFHEDADLQRLLTTVHQALVLYQDKKELSSKEAARAG